MALQFLPASELPCTAGPASIGLRSARRRRDLRAASLTHRLPAAKSHNAPAKTLPAMRCFVRSLPRQGDAQSGPVDRERRLGHSRASPSGLPSNSWAEAHGEGTPRPSFFSLSFPPVGPACCVSAHRHFFRSANLSFFLCMHNYRKCPSFKLLITK